jgi:hypothetical protein
MLAVQICQVLPTAFCVPVSHMRGISRQMCLKLVTQVCFALQKYDGDDVLKLIQVSKATDSHLLPPSIAW